MICVIGGLLELNFVVLFTVIIDHLCIKLLDYIILVISYLIS